MDQFKEKVLPFLEKHVQWLALGLGVLFLGLMAYSYLVQTPVTVPVAGQAVRPSAVDPAVAESPDMVRLKQEMGSTVVPENGVVPEVPPTADKFVEVFTTVPPVPDMKPPGALTPAVIVEAAPPPPPGAVVTIPQIGAATYLGSSSGRGIYTWTPLVPPPPVAAAPVPGGEGREGAVPPPAPVAPVIPPPPPKPVTSPLTDWTSHIFEVSLAEMSNAFKAANIDVNDPIVSKTAFLAVELYRQEKLPGGSWGSSVRVPPLPAYQPVMKEMPKPNAPQPEQIAYTQWAAQYVPLVVQPAFPTLVKGAPWVIPGTPPPAPANLAQAGMEGAKAPEPPPEPEPVEVAPPPEGGEGGEGGAAAVAVNVAPGLPSSPIPGAGAPGGVFNPYTLHVQALQAGKEDTKVQILTHDLTVAPGKTYRYMIRYHVRNPFWLVGGLPEALSGPFAVAAKDSGWSKEVSVAPRVEFFAKNIKPKRGTQTQDEVEFDMFFDQGGTWRPLLMSFAAGDQIGSLRDGTSGWSVVDVRRDPRSRTPKYYVIVADANGQAQRRDVEQDQASDRLRQLRPPPAPPAGAGEGEGGIMREGAGGCP